MDATDNGMPPGLRAVWWRKSRRSNPSGNCLEMALLPAGQVAVRNSRYPAGPVLVCARAEITAFLQGAKHGDFDALLGRSPARTRRRSGSRDRGTGNR